MRIFAAIFLGVQLITDSTGNSPKGSKKTLRTLIDSMRNPLAVDPPKERTLLQDKQDIEAMQFTLDEMLDPKPEEITLEEAAIQSSKAMRGEKSLGEVEDDWSLIRNRDPDLPRMQRKLDDLIRNNENFLQDIQQAHVRAPSGRDPRNDSG